MQGLQTAMVSGYEQSFSYSDGMHVVGELVVIRHDGNTAKGYAYPIGSSGSDIFLGKEYKRLPAHHFSTTGNVPVDDLFGHLPLGTFSTGNNGTQTLPPGSGSGAVP